MPTPRHSGFKGSIWTEEEKAILRDHWAYAASAAEVRKHLPRFTEMQIRSKAHHMGLKRRFTGSENVRFPGHQELADQIRLRAKQDGIPLYKLDEILNVGGYFSGEWKRRRNVHLGAIARALEFFGATLVIDWCDR